MSPLVRELIEEVRAGQMAQDLMDQAVADHLGINRTDLRCLDLLDRQGPMAASELAAGAGLSTGALTTAVDRLERAGFARRERDERDRRRVMIAIVPPAGDDLYGEHLQAAVEIEQRYSEQEIALIRDFLREGRELNERAAARVRALPARERPAK